VIEQLQRFVEIGLGCCHQLKVEYGEPYGMAAAFGAPALQRLRRSDLCAGLK